MVRVPDFHRAEWAFRPSSPSSGCPEWDKAEVGPPVVVWGAKTVRIRCRSLPPGLGDVVTG